MWIVGGSLARSQLLSHMLVSLYRCIHSCTNVYTHMCGVVLRCVSGNHLFTLSAKSTKSADFLSESAPKNKSRLLRLSNDPDSPCQGNECSGNCNESDGLGVDRAAMSHTRCSAGS